MTLTLDQLYSRVEYLDDTCSLFSIHSEEIYDCITVERNVYLISPLYSQGVYNLKHKILELFNILQSVH